MCCPPRIALQLCACIFAPWLVVAQAPALQSSSLKEVTDKAPAAPGNAKGEPETKATLKRAPDGTILAYEISTEGVAGAERATIDYTPDSRTIDYGEGQGGTVKENYYDVGVRKDVATSDGDLRTFTWERLSPKTERHVGGVWQGRLLTWMYDERGLPTTLEISNPGATGEPVQFILNFDKHARPATISGPGGLTGTYVYAEVTGKLTSFSRGNLQTTYTYDDIGRLSVVETTTKGSEVVYRYRHSYNQRHQTTERIAEGAGKSWNGMEYDKAGRLVKATGYAYAFDSNGRGRPGRESVTAPGKIEFLSEMTGYEGAGRPTGDALWDYQWDQRGLLVGVSRRADKPRDARVTAETVRYQYDGDRRLVRKVSTLKFTPATKRADFVEESRILWDGPLPVMEERTRPGAVLPRRWFVWGRDLGGKRSTAGGIGGLVAIIEEGKRTLLAVDDGAGNVMAVVDGATGQTVAKYNFGPMGEVEPVQGDADACPFRFQTRYFDRNSELLYAGGLFYLPRMGRWLGRIVLGEIEPHPLLW